MNKRNSCLNMKHNLDIDHISQTKFMIKLLIQFENNFFNSSNVSPMVRKHVLSPPIKKEKRKKAV